MGKLAVWNIATLDGFFEGPSAWDLAFHDRIWSDDLTDFSDRQRAATGALLFGRKTYEGMAAYWSAETGETAKFMNSVRKYVVSRTLEVVEWNNSVLVEGCPVDGVRRLKHEAESDLIVFGSAELCDTLLRHRLVDEYRLCIAPVLLGSGKRLFADDGVATELSLLEARPLASGAILARYALDAPNL